MEPAQGEAQVEEAPSKSVTPPADVNMDTAQVRDNAIFLSGVNDLNTKDVEKFVLHNYKRPFYMEWISDQHVNIIYDDPEDAFQALVAMTDEKEFEAPDPIAPTQLRHLKPHPSIPNVEITARFATEDDRKPSDSRKRSEYYARHGEPTRNDYLKRFGTRRSAPMQFGQKNILKKSRHEERDMSGDLFPDKTEGSSSAKNDDLFPSKLRSGAGVGKKRGGRRNRKRLRNKLGEAMETDEIAPEKPAANGESIYSNMQY